MNEISERAAIAGYVAMAARSASTRLVDAVDVPSVETYEDAGAVIDEVITQSRAVASRRVWSSVLAAAAAVLAVPEVSALIGTWAPVLAATVAALLAALSKISDMRSVK